MAVMVRVLASLALCAVVTACGGTGERATLQSDGPGPNARVLTPCEVFLQRVCGSINGADGACNGMAACTAAQLTATYEPNSCTERNGLMEQFPTCPLTDGGVRAGVAPPQACDDLRAKACGVPDGAGSSPCATDDGCLAASEIADAADSDLCVQALGDNTSYPRCL